MDNFLIGISPTACEKWSSRNCLGENLFSEYVGFAAVATVCLIDQVISFVLL